MEKFSLEENGYNRDEVNLFVSSVIKETEGIVKMCEAQKDEIRYLRESLNDSYDKNYQSLLDKALDTKDIIMNMARDDADVIVSDAKDLASHIVNDALIKVEEVEEKKKLIEDNVKYLEGRLRSILDDEKMILDAIKELDVR